MLIALGTCDMRKRIKIKEQALGRREDTYVEMYVSRLRHYSEAEWDEPNPRAIKN